MAEYQQLATSQTTSIVESHDSRELSDDDLVEVESFSSFRGYTPKEFEKLLVTFTATQPIYKMDSKIFAHFYAITSSFQMKPDDIIGICPMRKFIPFVSTRIAECAVESDPKAITDEICDESEIVAKIAGFKIIELPQEVATDFYFQFCYFNAGHEVIGISTPFRFQKEEPKDSTQAAYPAAQLSQVSAQLENLGENYESMVMEKRDDDDFIVVRSQESFLKERIEHLNKSNTLLEYLIRSLEKDLSKKNNELQDMSSSLNAERSLLAKVEEEKKQILVDLSDITQKHMQLQNSLTELKKLIDEERICNQQLQSELDNSNNKIRKLEETFQASQVDEVELKNILNDKEEEISMHRDMIANLKQINADLTKKLSDAEDKMFNHQSSLAKALNELRMITHEKDKFSDYDKFISENKMLKQRLSDLEIVKENQTREIKTLEDELRVSVSNLNNLDSKLQMERNANAAKEQKSALALDKTKFELIEMHARLEQSRVEYANLYRKYRSLQKDRSKIEKPTSTSALSRSESIISTPGASSPSSIAASLPKRVMEKTDDIDLQLQQLEKDEEVKHQASPAVNMLNAKKAQNLLIDIENEQQHSDFLPATPTEPAVVGGHTSVKTPITPVSAVINDPKEDNSTVSMPCIMCDQVILCHQHEDGSGQMREMVDHLEVVHKQKMCPVCSTLFDTKLPIFSTYFANHIQNHFNNIRYPNLNNN